MDFCESVDSIDQPDPHRKHECPPVKGFALLMISAWVTPLYIEKLVSFLLTAKAIMADMTGLMGDRESIISSSMR